MIYDGVIIRYSLLDAGGVVSMRDFDRRTRVTREYCPVFTLAELLEMSPGAAVFWRHNRVGVPSDERAYLPGRAVEQSGSSPGS